jgi:uncharacterized protein YdeI (YjbR/CyaY-like superfamily)
MQVFTPRKPKSVWSALNKRYVAELLEQNLMTPADLCMIEIAKSNGQWESLDKVEALEIPPDLAKALSKNNLAQVNFKTFPPSTKKFCYKGLPVPNETKLESNAFKKS